MGGLLGVLAKFGKIDQDDLDDEDGFEDDGEAGFREADLVEEASEPREENRVGFFHNKKLPQSVRRPAEGSQHVSSIHPTCLEDEEKVVNELLKGHAVILNLEGLDIGVAERVFDFTLGACFALSGKMKQISNYVFVIVPPSITLKGDFSEKEDESLAKIFNRV